MCIVLRVELLHNLGTYPLWSMITMSRPQANAIQVDDDQTKLMIVKFDRVSQFRDLVCFVCC